MSLSYAAADIFAAAAVADFVIAYSGCVSVAVVVAVVVFGIRWLLFLLLLLLLFLLSKSLHPTRVISRGLITKQSEAIESQ